MLAEGSDHASNGIVAPCGAFAISRDRRRYAFGHVICTDAHDLQQKDGFQWRHSKCG
jgi:hypothetical protein